MKGKLILTAIILGGGAFLLLSDRFEEFIGPYASATASDIENLKNMLKKISNIGDCGITCDFGDEVNKKTNKEVIKLFNFIQESVNSKKIKGILNYTPSYNKLIINFELGKIKSKEIIEFIKSRL